MMMASMVTIDVVSWVSRMESPHFTVVVNSGCSAMTTIELVAVRVRKQPSPSCFMVPINYC